MGGEEEIAWPPVRPCLHCFGEKEVCEPFGPALFELAWIRLRMSFDGFSSNDLLPVFDHSVDKAIRAETSRDLVGSFIAASSLKARLVGRFTLLAIQHGRHFPLKIRAELVEPTGDAGRSDWQIAKCGGIDPFDSAIPGRNMRGRQNLFRFVTRRNTVEVPICMASTPTASTLLPINISHALLHRRRIFF